MSNVKLQVTFVDVDVSNDGEPFEAGKIYFSFKVDGSVVTSRSVANPLKVSSGQVISLGDAATVTKSDVPGTSLTISGSLSERDSGLSGKDESASFTHRYDAGSNWGTGNAHSAIFADGKLYAKLNYLVQRV